MSACKKCRAGPMSVHILCTGLCQACQSELEWKRGPYIAQQQKQARARMAYLKKAEKYIDKKWKKKWYDFFHKLNLIRLF